MKRENNIFEWGKIRLALENKSYLTEGIEILKNMILIALFWNGLKI